jgi:CyaY protein
MTEAEFLDTCDRLLTAIEDALDRSGLDAETARSGHVLEIEFDDGAALIVNGNAPLREIWVAARSGAFHFRFVDGAWRDTRSAGELFATLSDIASRHAGQSVRLGPSASS